MKDINPIIWQSAEVNQQGVPFLTVLKAKGYYYYAERAGKDSIAFILIDNNKENCIGLIKELKPPIGNDVFLTTAFGGSLDKDIPLIEIVREEVKEEAGYLVNSNTFMSLGKIIPVGKVLVSTQMNQFCHLFVVDVTGLSQGKRDLDEHEFGSTVEWIEPEDLLTLQDWKAPLIYMKYTKNI